LRPALPRHRHSHGSSLGISRAGLDDFQRDEDDQGPKPPLAPPAARPREAAWTLMEGTMTDYALAYDLVKEQSSHDYEPLWAELKRLGGHRTEYSLWLINVNNTAKETCDQLRNYLDKDDRLWVLELTENHYFANATGGTNDWIMNNPPSR
jgi:hypothetical protein